MLGIICAEIEEEKEILKGIHVKEQREVSGFLFKKVMLLGQECVIVRSGVGKVNSAMCTQTLILTFSPDIVILTGVAGALNLWLDIGDVVISSHLVQYDFDLTAFRRQLGEVPLVRNIIENPIRSNQTQARIGSPGAETDSRSSVQLIRANMQLCHLACSAFDLLKKEDILNGKVAAGIIATGDRFVSKEDPFYSEFLTRVLTVFGALCVEMEGAAVGFVCQVNKVPFVAIRSICDHANIKASSDFEMNIRHASFNAAKVLSRTISLLNRSKL